MQTCDGHFTTTEACTVVVYEFITLVMSVLVILNLVPSTRVDITHIHPGYITVKKSHFLDAFTREN